MAQASGASHQSGCVGLVAPLIDEVDRGPDQAGGAPAEHVREHGARQHREAHGNDKVSTPPAISRRTPGPMTADSSNAVEKTAKKTLGEKPRAAAIGAPRTIGRQ
jgi:hypothetical protein